MIGDSRAPTGGPGKPQGGKDVHLKGINPKKKKVDKVLERTGLIISLNPR